MRILGLDEIRSSFQMSTAIEAVRAGFIAFSRGDVQLGKVGHLAFPHFSGDCHIKSAASTSNDLFVVKVASGFTRNQERGQPVNSGLMMLFDAKTGFPVCLLQDEGWLTDLRTGIAGMLAAQLIKPQGGACVGIVGTGVQARLQAQLALQFGGFEHAAVWGRNAESAERLAAELREAGLNVSASVSPSALGGDADVIVTTTPARSPVLNETMVRSNARVVAVGADAPGKQELSTALTLSMDVVLADSREQCIEQGEIATAYHTGHMAMDRIGSFGDALATQRALSGDASVLVDLTGLGVQDLAIATVAIQGALAA
ncbi:ornithine cyclodeaminase family protein [Stenotrophomonas maltophilia]|uniref:ornithine cyclodeaminase family protein n=1 Tax=Stenotrophomonas maltophilia TaxID=40324 RepID=UPI0015C5573D|nr:ornithine cyclodeaminase family protein [Stenotrophomonas maltophilia]